MKIPFLITARLKSRRLKKKIVKKVKKKELLSHMIERIKFSKKISNVIICTSNLLEDQPLNLIAKKNKVDIYRGSADDVILRLKNAAKKFNSKYVINITADCPLVDPYYIDKIATKLVRGKYDLIRSFDLPHGIFIYGIKVKALETICRIKKKKDTEIWERYFTDTKLFKVHDLKITNKKHKRPGLRLTCDYPEDFVLIKKIFNKLWKEKKLFNTNDIINLLDKNPTMLNINKNCAKKFSKKYNLNDQIKLDQKYFKIRNKYPRYKTFHEFLVERGVRT